MTDPQNPGTHPVPPGAPVPPSQPAPPAAPPQVPAPPATPAGSPYAAPTPPPPAYPAQPTPPAYPAQQAQPAYAAPPGAMSTPVGGYSEQYQPAPADADKAKLGLWALVSSLVALVVSNVMLMIAAPPIGAVLSGLRGDATRAERLQALSPVKGSVLVAEIGLWVGAIFAIVAIALGVMAIVKKSKRNLGLAALITTGVGGLILLIVAGATGLL